MKTHTILAFILIMATHTLKTIAQDYESHNIPNIAAASIPSSPAFSLLGVNPEVITRPSDIKQFKVDWRIKNYKLAPDLALEAQPIWWLYHRRRGLTAYRYSSGFSRLLSTTSVSMGTAKIDNVNHMAYAVKLNLYKSYDPFLNDRSVLEAEKRLSDEALPLLIKLDSARRETYYTKIPDTLRAIETCIDSLRDEIKLLRRTRLQELKDRSESFAREHWNMNMIDIAFGQVYKYDNAAIDSLKFEKAGFGVWLTGGKKVGKGGLLSGMVKMNRIGGNANWLYGLSYRHGSERFNFYIEMLRSLMNNNFNNGFADGEQFSSLYTEDLGSGWYQFQAGTPQHMWIMTYGGDFRLSKNILLNFALRAELKKDFKFNRFLPIANLVCLMQ